MVNILLIFILAHFLCDFVTQTNYIIKRKAKYKNLDFLRLPNKKYNVGIAEHVAHHIISTLLLLIVFGEFTLKLMIVTLIIGALHYLIDMIKINKSEEVIKKYQTLIEEQKNTFHYLLEKNTFHFLLDQFLHIVSIYLVLLLFQHTENPKKIFQLTNEFIFTDTSITNETKIISMAIFIILLTFGSAYLIVEIFKDINKGDLLTNQKTSDETAVSVETDSTNELTNISSNINNIEKNLIIERLWEFEETEDTKKSKQSIKIQYPNFNEKDNNAVGKYIGILERFLIAVFIIIDAYQGLVLLGAFKTLTRFRQFEDKSFAEKYLIGTLLSIVLGIIIGGCIKKVLL